MLRSPEEAQEQGELDAIRVISFHRKLCKISKNVEKTLSDVKKENLNSNFITMTIAYARGVGSS